MKHQNWRLSATTALLLALLLSPFHSTKAGGGGQNMILVIDPTDEHSLRIANAYQELRAIPDQNIVFIETRYLTEPEIGSGFVYKDHYLQPITDHIAAMGLGGQIDYIATLGQPYRMALDGSVNAGKNSISNAYSLVRMDDLIGGATGASIAGSSITTALFQDPPNSYTVGTNQALYHADTSQYMGGAVGFTGALGIPADQVISSLLYTATGDGAKPQGTVFFIDTLSVHTSPRRNSWAGTQAGLTARGIPWIHNVVSSSTAYEERTPTNHNAVRGAVIGGGAIRLANGSTYLPGSWADSLTSFGCTFNTEEQVKITAFIAAGTGGSGGTVVEPYAIQARFTESNIHLYSADGSTLGEAFYKSVKAPDIQMFIGDLLAQPYADQPTITFDGSTPAEGATATGSITIEASATLSTPTLATIIARIELYVDGTLTETVAAATASFSLDTTILDDGYHEIRAVAVNDAAAESEHFVLRHVMVDNHGRSVTVVGGDLNLSPDQKTTVLVNTTNGDGTIDHVELRHLGRIAVGDVTSDQLDATQLAYDANKIVPVAIFSDGQQVAGVPFTANRARTILTGHAPLAANYRHPGVEAEYFLGKGAATIAASDFSGTPDLLANHPALPTTNTSAMPGAEMPTTQIDQLAVRVKGLFEVVAGDEGEYQFGLWRSNDSMLLKIDGVQVLAYDGLSQGATDSKRVRGSLFLGSGEHTYELLAANVNDDKFFISGYVRDPHGVTRFLDGDGQTTDPQNVRDPQPLFPIYYRTLVSQLSAVTVDGDENVTSVTVDSVTFQVDELTRVGEITSFASAGNILVIVDTDAAIPAPGERAALLVDDSLKTGFTNLGSANDAVQLQFDTPIVNRFGADLILFELGGGDTFIFQTKSGGTFSANSAGLVAGHTAGKAYGISSGNVDTLTELESIDPLILKVGVTQNIHAILIDLSDLGYAEGESLSTLLIGSPDGADLMAVFGLPKLLPGTIAIEVISAGGIQLHLEGSPGQGFILETSADLSKWQEAEKSAFDPTGELLYNDSTTPGNNSRFYRWRSR